MINFFKKRFKRMKNKKGFTLVELIVVIVIVGILAAILIPRLTGFTDKARDTEALVYAKEVATAFDSLAAEKDGSYSTITVSQVQDLSGVSGSGITVTINTADGGVKVATANGSAGRDTSDDKVVAPFTGTP